MQVLLDSNIYGRDLTLAGAKFRLLFDQAKEGQFRLALPEVIAREVTELYRREVSQRQGELVKASKRLGALRIPVLTEEAVDAEEASTGFRKLLEAKVLDAGGQLLPLPNVSHEELVELAVRRRRPFREKGSGYRDALIWQSVLGLAEADETVAFVTDNHRDFAGPDGQTLHADLVGQLHEAGTDPASVLLYRDLDDFFNAWAARAENALKRVRMLLTDKDAIEKLEEQLGVALAMRELPHEGRPFLASIGVDAEGAWIDTLESIEPIQASEAFALAEHAASIEFEVITTVTVDFLAHKGDVYAAERMHDLGDEIDPTFSVYDFDYNETLAAAETRLQVALTFQATYVLDTNELTDIEVTDIEPTERF